MSKGEYCNIRNNEQLFKLEWSNGFVCEQCSHKECFVTNTRKNKLYECKDCRYQSTVTVGTVMEKQEQI